VNDTEPQAKATERLEHSRLRVRATAALSSLDRLRLEYLYLIVALVWGTALIVLMPPFQVPDEPAHFYRSWGLAQGRVLPPRDFHEVLPENVWTLVAAFPIGAINSPGPYEGYSPHKIGDLLGEEISSHKASRVTAIPSQNPVGYLPQALGIEVARVTGLSPLAAFYLARASNLLVAVLLVFLALRIAPFGKVMFLIPALLPVTVAEMASVSPDALAISGAMFFTALTLALSERTVVRTGQMALVAATAGVLLAIKPGYFALAALIFLIPPRSLPSRRTWALWMSGIVALVLFIAVLMAVTPPTAPADLASQLGPSVPGADALSQLRWSAAHPLGFVDAMFNTIGTSASDIAFTMTSMLSWYTIRVSQVAGLLLLGLVLVLIPGLESEPGVGLRRRAILLGTWVASVSMICLALYMAQTPVGHTFVYGIQGRYFTPMLPLLLLGLYRIRLRRPSAVVILLLIVIAAVVLLTLRAVWFHYYQ